MIETINIRSLQLGSNGSQRFHICGNTKPGHLGSFSCRINVVSNKTYACVAVAMQDPVAKPQGSELCLRVTGPIHSTPLQVSFFSSVVVT